MNACVSKVFDCECCEWQPVIIHNETQYFGSRLNTIRDVFVAVLLKFCQPQRETVAELCYLIAQDEVKVAVSVHALSLHLTAINPLCVSPAVKLDEQSETGSALAIN